MVNEVRVCPGCQVALPADAPQGMCPTCLFRFILAEDDPARNARSAPTTAHRPAFLPPSPAELSASFPQLEVLELIGQGGMGAVYKARQKRLDRLVALKIISPELAGDPAFAERFAREARTLAKLSHPNVLAVYDFGEADGLYFFLMEYIDGVNLRQMMRAGEVKPENALALVPQICAALQYAHDQGIVHRDIKPENILVDRLGRVKIADFGLAKLLGPSVPAPALTGSGQVMGTPHYMAPEQVEQPLNVDHRADIYSLGVVFYELLTGELPLGKFPPPSRKAAVDARLDEVVLRTLERDPGGRYQHASEIGTAVEEIAHTLPEEIEAIKQALNVTGEELGLLAALVLGLGLLGVAVYATREMYWLFGLPLLLIIAGSLPMGRSAKPTGVILLGLGGLALSVLAVYLGCGGKWMLFPIWLWFGHTLTEIGKDEVTAGEPAKVEGLSPLAEAVWKVLWRHQSTAGLTVVPDLPATGLHQAREACAVPPDERILAMLDLTGDEDDCSQCLLFGCRGFYLDATTGEGTAVAIPYSEFPRRTFANHGLAVFLGQSQTFKPDLDNVSVTCEEITELLNGLRQAIVELEQGYGPQNS